MKVGTVRVEFFDENKYVYRIRLPKKFLRFCRLDYAWSTIFGRIVAEGNSCLPLPFEGCSLTSRLQEYFSLVFESRDLVD